MLTDVPFSNMVTSLLEHEQIKTTLPKAREAARMAEKVSSYSATSTDVEQIIMVLGYHTGQGCNPGISIESLRTLAQP